MPLDAPFKLGPFDVDCEGRLSLSEPMASPAFLFRWRDRTVRAQLAQVDRAGGLLSLQVMAGRVPSTADAGDEQKRPRSFALLHRLPGAVPPSWRVCLSPDHRVSLVTEARIALPVTATELVTTMTCFALDLAPYLDLLDENGVSV